MLRNNNRKLIVHQLRLFLTERSNPIASSSSSYPLTYGSSSLPYRVPEPQRASSLSGLLHRPWRPEADQLASDFASRGLLSCHRLFSRPLQAIGFCAAPAVGLKGLVVDGSRALKFFFHRRSGFDPKRLLSLPQLSLWRRFMPVAGGDEVVFGLIGANVVIFLLWRIADPAFMRKHFMVSLDNFKSWRLHTLITSAFSHSDAGHLMTNMIGLYFFGSSIANLFGPEFLLKLYLGGALGGSIFYLVHKAFMVPSSKGYRGWDESRIPALGASAAVNAIILLNVFLFPKNIYYINFIIPVPAALLGAFLIGTDLWRIKKMHLPSFAISVAEAFRLLIPEPKEGEGHISGSAHLGGAVVAALVWARLKRWI